MASGGREAGAAPLPSGFAVALNELQQALAQKKSDTVPDGWLTAQQWAAQWGLKTAQTLRLLSDSIHVGITERREFTIVVNGMLRKVPHYRVQP